jgi:hypothetical protein
VALAQTDFAAIYLVIGEEDRDPHPQMGTGSGSWKVTHLPRNTSPVAPG